MNSYQTKSKKQMLVIVSMTSYPKRIHLVPLAYNDFIEMQTVKADKYILWLSKEEFGEEKSSLELGLQDIEEKGVEIKWINEKSYVHIRHLSCKLWPEAYNIMIDEDFYYPPTYVEELLEASKTRKKSVISYMACVEIFSGYKKYELPRLPWSSVRNKFNGGLVCFPPYTYPQECFTYSNIRDLICPLHDETWVNLFLKFKGTKVYGIHRINWDICNKHYIYDEAMIEHLHSRNTDVEKCGYSMDISQFNRVLYVFPQIKEVYNKLFFGFYDFKDFDEISEYESLCSIIEKI